MSKFLYGSVAGNYQSYLESKSDTELSEYRKMKANVEFSDKKAKLIADINSVKEKYNPRASNTIHDIGICYIFNLLLNYMNDQDIIIAVEEYIVKNLVWRGDT
jgi:hypothetical protein